MSDKDDLSHLTSTTWRERNAAALAQAIDDFFAPRLLAGAGIRR
jgi:N-acetylmuramoyl-L-alanine amidase